MMSIPPHMTVTGHRNASLIRTSPQIARGGRKSSKRALTCQMTDSQLANLNMPPKDNYIISLNGAKNRVTMFAWLEEHIGKGSMMGAIREMIKYKNVPFLEDGKSSPNFTSAVANVFHISEMKLQRMVLDFETGVTTRLEMLQQLLTLVEERDDPNVKAEMNMEKRASELLASSNLREGLTKGAVFQQKVEQMDAYAAETLKIMHALRAGCSVNRLLNMLYQFDAMCMQGQMPSAQRDAYVRQIDEELASMIDYKNVHAFEHSYVSLQNACMMLASKRIKFLVDERLANEVITLLHQTKTTDDVDVIQMEFPNIDISGPANDRRLVNAASEKMAVQRTINELPKMCGDKRVCDEVRESIDDKLNQGITIKMDEIHEEILETKQRYHEIDERKAAIKTMLGWAQTVKQLESISTVGFENDENLTTLINFRRLVLEEKEAENDYYEEGPGPGNEEEEEEDEDLVEPLYANAEDISHAEGRVTPSAPTETTGSTAEDGSVDDVDFVMPKKSAEEYDMELRGELGSSWHETVDREQKMKEAYYEKKRMQREQQKRSSMIQSTIPLKSRDKDGRDKKEKSSGAIVGFLRRTLDKKQAKTDNDWDSASDISSIATQKDGEI